MLNLTQLNISDSLQHRLGDITNSITSRNLDILSIITNPVNGRNNGSCTGTEHLDQLAALLGLDHFMNANFPLADLEVLRQRIDGVLATDVVLCDVEDGVSGDTRKNHSIERGSDEFDCISLLERDEKVHCSDLCQEMLLAKQPKVLLVPALRSLELGKDTRSVVSTKLVLSGSSRPGTNLVGIRLESYRLEASLVIRSDRTANNKQQCIFGRVHTERGLSTNKRRSDVERMTGFAWDPTLVESYELFDESDKLFAFESGESDTRSRSVHTLHVHIGSKEANFAVNVLVGFHSLKERWCVVEDDGARIELEWGVGVDFGCVPTGSAVPGDGKHVIGKVGSEDEALGRRRCTGCVRVSDDESRSVEVL